MLKYFSGHMQNSSVRNLTDNWLLINIFSSILLLEGPIKSSLREWIILRSLLLKISMVFGVSHDLLELRLVYHALFLIEVVPNIIEDIKNLPLNRRIDRLSLENLLLSGHFRLLIILVVKIPILC